MAFTERFPAIVRIGPFQGSVYQQGMKDRPADVIVIGGGIVGTSVAVALQERGRSVLLLDPGNAEKRASYGNAGMINRASLFPVASPFIWRNLSRYVRNADASLHIDYANIFRILPWLRRFLTCSSEDGWRRAAAALDPLTDAAWSEHQRLSRLAGAEHLLDRCGWIRLYRSDAAFMATALERDILASRRITFEVVDGPDIAALEPALRRSYSKAVLYPEMSLVRNPGRLVFAYQKLFTGLGGRMLQAEIRDLSRDGDSWVASWPGDQARAGQVVLAAGAWSDQLTQQLGYNFPLAAERGYHRHFAPSGRTLARPVHDTGGGCVICPMEQGTRVLCGVDLAPINAPPHHRLINGAVKAAGQIVDLGSPIESTPWMGSRPSSPDGLPIIGFAPRHPHLVFAFGHGHIGLSTGPVTGRLVADLLLGAPPSLSIEAFSPTRF